MEEEKETDLSSEIALKEKKKGEKSIKQAKSIISGSSLSFRKKENFG